MPTVVRFSHVSKQYQIGTGQGSIREALTSVPRRLLGKPGDVLPEGDQIWALRDVSFDLERGQILGLIGRNGAGKTTMLKLLSGVTRPTHGKIDVEGRISALIELGAGFHPDLTGRDNIYLNGAILGLSRSEIDQKFGKIVAFAELEKFIDTPVKRYSSGMYARLGFAVAAHSDPDILLVDEVLAVGDVAFQRKCHDFLHSFVNQGKTAVFVSHSMHVLEQLCNRLLWIEYGEVQLFGAPPKVLQHYLDHIEQKMLAELVSDDTGPSNVRLGPVVFKDSGGSKRDTFGVGDDIVIDLHYHTESRVYRPRFHVGVASPDTSSLLFTASMLIDGEAPPSIEGDGVVTCRFESLPLMPKVYNIWGEVWDESGSRRLAEWQRLGTFRIVDHHDDRLNENVKGSVWHKRADALFRVQYTWEY